MIAWLMPHITTAIARAKQHLAYVLERRDGETRQRDNLIEYRLTLVATLFVLWGILIFVRLVQLQTTALQSAIYEWAVSVRRGVLALGFSFLIASLGFGFSVWKKKRLLSYSLSEIVFGCVLADHVGYRLVDQPALPEFLASASALYVIARGFSNLRDARQQAAKASPVDSFTSAASMQDSAVIPHRA